MKTLNVVLRRVLPSPLGRGVREFMLLAFAGRTTPMLGLRRAGREIGLKFPAGRLPTLDEVTELARRNCFGVVRLSGKT
ncbi:hypothetical protein [Amycolatopsis sp. MEPSY49]|uniref:hypothetical protein n=1 Tax=Amycolatopsis sp. MEPSY49 TaxID=3151600 RepID=UPI003EF1FAEF